MTSELFREHLTADLRAKILKDYEQFRGFKDRNHLGSSVLMAKEALVHEHAILNDLIDFSRPVPIASHRAVTGALIVLTKKIVMRIMGPIIRISMSRQILLNEQLVNSHHLVKSLENRVLRLERDQKLLLKRLEDRGC
jgi:hypothetical protein